MQTNNQNPTIIIFDYCKAPKGENEVHSLVKAIFRNEKEENVLVNEPLTNKYTWKLVTKYF